MTATLIIYDDPAGISRREKEIPSGVPLIETIAKLYPNGFLVPTKIYRSNFSDENELDLNKHIYDGVKVKNGDVFVISHRPLDPFITPIVIGFAVSFAVSYFLAPSVPDVPETSTQSPNRQSLNKVSGQLNTARPMQRIPDVYGSDVKIYPDLLSPQLYEYKDSLTQIQQSVLTPGFGRFDVREVRIGSSPITFDDFEDSNDSYWFDMNPDNFNLKNYYEFDESEEVNGQLLKGTRSKSFTENITSPPARVLIGNENNGKFVFYNFSSEMSAKWALFKEDDIFTISNAVRTQGDFSSPGVLDQDYIFSSFDGNYLITKNAYVSQPPIIFPDGSQNSSVFFTGTFSAQDQGAADFTKPFILNDIAEEIWLDFLFPKGLKKDPAKEPVRIEVKIENIITGWTNIVALSRVYRIERDTLDSQAITIKIDHISQDPASFEDKIYEVSCKRLDEESQDSQFPNETKWGRLSAVKKFGAASSVSTILVNRIGNSQPTKSTRNKINATVDRFIPSFDFSTGQFSENLTKTSIFLESFMYHAVYRCGKTVDQINYAELYESYLKIININPALLLDLVKFQYSFSSKNSVANNELGLICNAARIMVYEQGDLMRFYPVVRQTIPRYIFTRRHKAPNSETKTYQLKLPNDPDYISLEYYDVEDDAWRTINYAGTWGEYDELGIKEKKITLSGATNWNQAYNRCALEYEILSKQRTTLNTTVTNDALMLSLGDLVYHVDGNDTNSIDGDIIKYEQSASDSADCILTLSESFVEERLDGPASEYTVVLQDVEGNTPTFSKAFTIESSNKIKIENYNNALLQPNSINQARPTFAIIKDGHEEYNKYIVTSITPVGRSHVDLELKNYDDSIFNIDNLVIPEKPKLRPEND